MNPNNNIKTSGNVVQPFGSNPSSPAASPAQQPTTPSGGFINQFLQNIQGSNQSNPQQPNLVKAQGKDKDGMDLFAITNENGDNMTVRGDQLKNYGYVGVTDNGSGEHFAMKTGDVGQVGLNPNDAHGQGGALGNAAPGVRGIAEFAANAAPIVGGIIGAIAGTAIAPGAGTVGGAALGGAAGTGLEELIKQWALGDYQQSWQSDAKDIVKGAVVQGLFSLIPGGSEVGGAEDALTQGAAKTGEDIAANTAEQGGVKAFMGRLTQGATEKAAGSNAVKTVTKLGTRAASGAIVNAVSAGVNDAFTYNPDGSIKNWDQVKNDMIQSGVFGGVFNATMAPALDKILSNPLDNPTAAQSALKDATDAFNATVEQANKQAKEAGQQVGDIAASKVIPSMLEKAAGGSFTSDAQGNVTSDAQRAMQLGIFNQGSKGINAQDIENGINKISSEGGLSDQTEQQLQQELQGKNVEGKVIADLLPSSSASFESMPKSEQAAFANFIAQNKDKLGGSLTGKNAITSANDVLKLMQENPDQLKEMVQSGTFDASAVNQLKRSLNYKDSGSNGTNTYSKLMKTVEDASGNSDKVKQLNDQAYFLTRTRSSLYDTKQNWNDFATKLSKQLQTETEKQMKGVTDELQARWEKAANEYTYQLNKVIKQYKGSKARTKQLGDAAASLAGIAITGGKWWGALIGRETFNAIDQLPQNPAVSGGVENYARNIGDVVNQPNFRQKVGSILGGGTGQANPGAASALTKVTGGGQSNFARLLQQLMMQQQAKNGGQ